MVFDLTYLGPSRQKVFKVPAPPGGVFTDAVFAGSGPIKDVFNSAAYPAGGLGLSGPDWLQHLHHERDIDTLHRERPEDGVGVGFERVAPLVGVLGGAPSGLLGLYVRFRRVLEGDRLGGFQAGSGHRVVPRLDGIDAGETQLPGLQRLYPCVSQGDGMERPQTHVPWDPVEHVPIDP